MNRSPIARALAWSARPHRSHRSLLLLVIVATFACSFGWSATGLAQAGGSTGSKQLFKRDPQPAAEPAAATDQPAAKVGRFPDERPTTTTSNRMRPPATTAPQEPASTEDPALDFGADPGSDAPAGNPGVVGAAGAGLDPQDGQLTQVDPASLAGPQGAPAETGLDAGAATVPTAVRPVPSRRTQSFVGWMLEASGVFGFLILLSGLVLASLVFVNLLQLRRELFLPVEFLDDFERRLDAREYQAAYELASHSDSLIGRVLAAGLSRVSRGYASAERAMQQVGDDETLALEQKIGYVSLIASVAPLLGLLGTMQGLLLSFQQLASSPTQPRLDMMTDGVATALFTTMEGLLVSLPALVFYTLFRNRLARFSMETAFVATNLMSRFQEAEPGPVTNVIPGLPSSMASSAGNART